MNRAHSKIKPDTIFFFFFLIVKMLSVNTNAERPIPIFSKLFINYTKALDKI